MTIKTEITETITQHKATAAIFEGAIRIEDDTLLNTFDTLLQAKAIEGAIKIYYQTDNKTRLITIPITPEPEKEEKKTA
jgi:hypothetical protein